MKSSLYKKSLCILVAVCMTLVLFALSISAASFMRPGYGRTADSESTADPYTDSTADENGMVGENTTAAGTGEFGDNTSNNSGNSYDSQNGTKDSGNNIIDNAENAVSDVVNGAENAVDDMTGGMSVWSILLIIAIIVVIVVLVIVFFTRRK